MGNLHIPTARKSVKPVIFKINKPQQYIYFWKEETMFSRILVFANVSGAYLLFN